MTPSKQAPNIVRGSDNSNRPSIQNQSFLRKCTQVVFSCLKFLPMKFIKLIQFIWTAIFHTLIYTYRKTCDSFEITKRSIKRFFNKKSTVSLEYAMHRWSVIYSLDKRARITRLAITATCQIHTLERAIAKWLSISIENGITVEKFFEQLRSIELRISSPRRHEVFNAIIEKLSVNDGKAIIKNKWTMFNFKTESVETVKMEVEDLLNNLIDIENQLFETLEQSLPNMTQEGRISIIQSGLIVNDHRQMRNQESVLIGRSDKYCFASNETINSSIQ